MQLSEYGPRLPHRLWPPPGGSPQHQGNRLSIGEDCSPAAEPARNVGRGRQAGQGHARREVEGHPVCGRGERVGDLSFHQPRLWSAAPSERLPPCVAAGALARRVPGLLAFWQSSVSGGEAEGRLSTRVPTSRPAHHPHTCTHTHHRQYYVLRQKGTEPPNTGKLNKHYETGIYTCAGCNTPLYK